MNEQINQAEKPKKSLGELKNDIVAQIPDSDPEKAYKEEAVKTFFNLLNKTLAARREVEVSNTTHERMKPGLIRSFDAQIDQLLKQLKTKTDVEVTIEQILETEEK